MRTDVETLRRRLKPWSPADLQLQALSYGRLVTGEIELPPDSHQELIRRLDALENGIWGVNAERS